MDINDLQKEIIEINFKISDIPMMKRELNIFKDQINSLNTRVYA